jgi:hypothetical protein
MPIRPENLHRYPKDWPQIRQRILERARHCCEGSPAFSDCRVANYAWGYWVDGSFQRVNKQAVIDAVRVGREWVKPPVQFGEHRIIEIVLTIGHLDHVPEHCDPANLRAWCQRCHLQYDARHHAQTRYRTRREGRAAEDMFP